MIQEYNMMKKVGHPNRVKYIKIAIQKSPRKLNSDLQSYFNQNRRNIKEFLAA